MASLREASKCFLRVRDGIGKLQLRTRLFAPSLWQLLLLLLASREKTKIEKPLQQLRF